MDQETKQALDIATEEIIKRLVNLELVMNKRFENLKKVVGDYLELSSNISIATVKANLKNV